MLCIICYQRKVGCILKMIWVIIFDMMYFKRYGWSCVMPPQMYVAQTDMITHVYELSHLLNLRCYIMCALGTGETRDYWIWARKHGLIKDMSKLCMGMGWGIFLAFYPYHSRINNIPSVPFNSLHSVWTEVKKYV